MTAKIPSVTFTARQDVNIDLRWKGSRAEITATQADQTIFSFVMGSISPKSPPKSMSQSSYALGRAPLQEQESQPLLGGTRVTEEGKRAAVVASGILPKPKSSQRDMVIHEPVVSRYLGNGVLPSGPQIRSSLFSEPVSLRDFPASLTRIDSPLQKSPPLDLPLGYSSDLTFSDSSSQDSVSSDTSQDSLSSDSSQGRSSQGSSPPKETLLPPATLTSAGSIPGPKMDSKIL